MLTEKSRGLLGIGILVALVIPAFAVATADIRRLVRGTAHVWTVALAVVITAVLVAALMQSIKASGRT